MIKPIIRYRKLLIILVFSIVVSATFIKIVFELFYTKSDQNKSSSLASRISSIEADNISARGRIEPQGNVIRLSASTSLETVKIKEILVKEGDIVSKNQVIAILDNFNSRFSALKQAEKLVKVSKANLAKVKAGAKTGQIIAQKAQIARFQAQLTGEGRKQRATIARLQAQLLGERRAQDATIARLQTQFTHAYKEFERYQMLYEEGAVDALTFDSKRLELETARAELNAGKAILNRTDETLQQQIIEARASLKQTQETLQQQISEAKATLNQIAQIRPTDIHAALAEIESANAVAEKAKEELELAYVRAPKEGQILKIYTFPGEIVSDQGIADMGQTDHMYVIAEVYETDVGHVSVGQKAKINSEALARELQGKVTKIGLQVLNQGTYSTNPIEDVDRRVVEVTIRLNQKDSKHVKSLTNLQVEIVIDI